MTELEQAIELLPSSLTLECKFQGWKHEETDRLNQEGTHQWSVTLRYNGQSFTVPYNQGIGTANSPTLGHTFAMRTYGACAPSDWRTSRSVDAVNFRAVWYKDKRSAALPKIADVLSCLLSGANSGRLSFEEFCSEFGCDTDSRKAYSTWESCKNSLIGLFVLFGKDFHVIEGKEH